MLHPLLGSALCHQREPQVEVARGDAPCVTRLFVKPQCGPEVRSRYIYLPCGETELSDRPPGIGLTAQVLDLPGEKEGAPKGVGGRSGN